MIVTNCLFILHCLFRAYSYISIYIGSPLHALSSFHSFECSHISSAFVLKNKMGGPNIWEEQRNFVKNLHEQGILDSRFDEILDLPRENPQFVIDLVTKFCSDAENSIAVLIRYHNEPDINYPKVIDRAHQIKGASSCIGGHRMALASRELRYACEDKDKDRWREI
ncbi:histidine-containing phosphotransfer protein 2 isoform X2 [Populus trichocarpa]|uniref:histidine-containing phosphotransfer protein 2 isoform X2 n=1 Tax=Populus trichocarpa TaxID=3694 RepID=UPI002277C5A5|nr:histidine-containing phosphotransfer protein 2 isoform X2 [Populus trichocarpa]